MKVAEKYEQNGMTDSAMSIYEDIYYQKKDPDAHIALNRVFHEYVLRTQSEISMMLTVGDFSNALSRCEKLTSEVEEASWYESNVRLQLNELRDQILAKQSSKLMSDLRSAVMSHSHLEADEIIAQLSLHDQQNQELQHLIRLNRIIPLYRSAEKAFEEGYFAKAHTIYSEVIEEDRYYKDAQEKLDACLDQLTFTLSFITKDKGHQAAGPPIAKAIKNELHAIESPFLKMIDPENDQWVLEEQRRSMTGVTQNSIEGGNLLEANYLLVGQISTYQTSLSKPKRFIKEGFEGSSTRSEKVRYTEVHQNMKVYAVYSYEIINTENGEVLTSEEVVVNEHFQNVHIEFDGNRKLLHPGDWSFGFITLKSDHVDHSGKSDLDLKLANNPLQGHEQELLDLLWSNLALEVAKEVECLLDGGDFFK